MKSMSIAKMLLVVIAVILIAIPLCIAFETKADADATNSSITKYDDNYVFFVVEDSKTPLAAIPVQSGDNRMIVWVIAAMGISIVMTAYSLWYFNMKNTKSIILRDLPQYAKNELSNRQSFFHPIRTRLACREAAYTAANRYLGKDFDI